MTPAQFERVAVLFDKAVELSPAAQSEFLNRHVADDDEVRQKVIRMLERDACLSKILESPALANDDDMTDSTLVDDGVLGEFAESSQYRILEKIGEGGFGVVYKAEQLEPVRRMVALKIIKRGMDTQQVVARFEAERQALAIMDHPAIAKIFDAGVTPAGRPYFAMELVDGVPITRYCDDRKLGIAERLRLFVRVCQAVQHAHQKGTIHRDIKPSNVLVSDQDGEPAPKVIDFGISRAVVEAQQGSHAITLEGQPLGTPIYMSPEQAAGNHDIDTRTDVYSLGILLYELLTGEPTINRQSAEKSTPVEVLRRVREMDVDRPSQRASAIMRRETGVLVAAQRDVAPKALARKLRGDLDCIVLTALANDRSRRYETVAALADDINRHHADEPIRAQGPGVGSRVFKFARRNRVSLMVVFLTIAALIGTSIGLVRSIAAESRARTDALIAQEINDFLNNDLLAAVAPEELGSDVRMRDVVEAASQRVEGKFADQPLVEASIRLTLGRTFHRLADFASAKRHLERALALRGQEFGEADARTLEVLHELGELSTLTADYKESELLLARAFEGRKKTLGQNDPATLLSQYHLGIAFGEQGRFAETEELITDSLRRCRATLGPTASQTLSTLRGLAVLYRSMGEFDKALPLYEESYASSREVLGVRDPNTLLSMQDLAGLLLHSGDQKRALDLLIEAVDTSKSVRGPKHPGTLMAMSVLANAHEDNGNVERAELVALEAVETAQHALPEDHPVTLRLMMMLAEIYDRTEQFDKAEPLLLTALEKVRIRFGEDSPLTQSARSKLAQHYRARDKITEAEKALESR